MNLLANQPKRNLFAEFSGSLSSTRWSRPELFSQSDCQCCNIVNGESVQASLKIWIAPFERLFDFKVFADDFDNENGIDKKVHLKRPERVC